MHHVIPFVNITIQWGKVCNEAQNQYYLLDDKLFLKIRDNWTKSPNLRAIDVWVILCYVGVFYCLMEYCIVLHLTKRQKTMALATKIEVASRFLVPFYIVSFFTTFFAVCTMQQGARS